MLRSSLSRPPFVQAPLPVAAALCLAALGVAAQSLPPYRKSPPPELPKAAPAPSPVVTLTADDLLSHIGGVAQARGSVVLQRGDVTLRADYLSFDQLSDTAHAEGHVRIDRGLDWFSASRLDLELSRDAGTLLDTEYEIGETHSGGHAQRIELHDRDHATTYQGDYSSCPRDVPGHPPDWIITGDKIDIDTATNEGHATHAKLRFLGVPILAAPSFSFPVTAERKSGWLPPTSEFSSSNGFSLAVPYYWNLRPNIDLTLTPEIITRRGPGLSGEVRYLEPEDIGQVTATSIPHDTLTGTSRGAVQWAHEGGRDDWLSYSARLQRVTDDAYWKDFQYQMPALDQRLLPLDVSGTRRFEFGDTAEIDAYARVQRFQTLQDFEDPSAVILSPYQRTPQIGVRGNATLPSKLRFTWETEANRFDLSDQSRPATPLNTFTPDTRVGGDRAHVVAALSREFSSPWGRFEPRLSINGATYHSDAPLVDSSTGLVAADGRTDISRWIPTFSADSSFSFEREARLFGHDTVQTLEPRLLYVLTPYHNQNLVPIYDTAPKDFNEFSIYSDNQFTGIDRIADENQLTAGATTRYNDAVNGRELLRLGIAQRLLFKDQIVTPAPVPSPDKEHVSDLLLWGSSSLTENWSFDGTFEFNPASDWTQRAIISTRYHPGPYKTMSATYRFARGSIEQYEVSGQWPVFHRDPAASGGTGGCGGTLYVVGRANYSVNDRRANFLLGGFEYDAGCWIGRFMVERQSTGRNEASTHFTLQLELNGLSTLGTGSLRVLQDNVPGYQPLRNDPGASR